MTELEQLVARAEEAERRLELARKSILALSALTVELARDVGEPGRTRAEEAPESGEWIQTYSGKKFYPLNPSVEDVDVVDIAHALSLQCRYTGHINTFYSVAEHSVRVVDALELAHAHSWGKSAKELRPLLRWGLMHDASEAYLVDVARPVKRSKTMAPYREAEDRLMTAICQRYGLPLEEPPSVKRADVLVGATEARYLFTNIHPDWVFPVPPMAAPIVPWTPAEAEHRFLECFERLFPTYPVL